MSSIRRRLTLHFTYQMLLLFVFVLAIMAIIVLTIVSLLMNEDLKRTFPTASLDAIITETLVTEKSADVPKRWEKQLQKQGYWLQVVNYKGNVMYSSNAPDEIPVSYTAGQLLTIQKTKRFGPYDLMTGLDDSVPNSALFLLGHVNEGAVAVEAIFRTYSQNGLPRAEDTAKLSKELKAEERSLEVMDDSGKVVQTYGMPTAVQSYEPLELVRMETLKGYYPTNVSVYADMDSGYFWVLHDAKQGSYVKQPFLKDLIIASCAVGAFVLAATLAFSIYHGYRYGRPLLLFIEWFRRLGQGNYKDTLSEKERKRIYRKSGKLRSRYKLYKEVIDGFHDMASKLDAAEQDRLRLEKTREEWMSGISHDLRTPLSTIQGYGHLLESGQFGWSDEELRDMGETIREKSDYMIDLIQDFSLAFQLKNKQVPFEVTRVELGEFVRRIVLKYVNDITLGDVVFHYGGEDHPVYVMANDKWFTRMMDNILINAVKHNPPGTAITVTLQQWEEEAVLFVRDNGGGMDEETLRNLFDRYYRGTNTEESSDGVGLGMNIAKSIVMAHNGTIQADSGKGRGTLITMRFPAVEDGDGNKTSS
ncbi:sensor histidine kinase [Paenibacillus sp. GCM10027627]|uniref:sensor histidine kinase n=1 Tax=unclassified Paenibacillus TaxID=185978 RepID=UPI003635FFB3